MVSIDPSFYNYEPAIINTIELGQGVSGCFPTLRNTSKTKGNKKMAKTDKFKVVIKDGDTKYVANKQGAFVTKTVDYVSEFDSLAPALEEFLSFVSDDYAEDKVSLNFVRGGKK